MQIAKSQKSHKDFLADEQGRLLAFVVCDEQWRSPDGTVIVVMTPEGKMVAYKVSP